MSTDTANIVNNNTVFKFNTYFPVVGLAGARVKP